MAKSKSNPQIALRPQDVVVLLRLSMSQDEPMSYAALAEEVQRTASEVRASMKRAVPSQLATKNKDGKPDVTPYPEISCAALTEASWVEFVETSLSCLDAERQFQGRSCQMVTRLSSQARSMMEVSPHLTIWTPTRRIKWLV